MRVTPGCGVSFGVDEPVQAGAFLHAREGPVRCQRAPPGAVNLRSGQVGFTRTSPCLAAAIFRLAAFSERWPSALTEARDRAGGCGAGRVPNVPFTAAATAIGGLVGPRPVMLSTAEGPDPRGAHGAPRLPSLVRDVGPPRHLGASVQNASTQFGMCKSGICTTKTARFNRIFCEVGWFALYMGASCHDSKYPLKHIPE